MMDFRIKSILKERGITALILAQKIDMTQANLSNIMTGKTTPTLPTLQKIADALQVPISDLFEQPQQNIITCPHCNGKIKVSKDE